MKTPKIDIAKLLNQINSFGDDAKRGVVSITNSTAKDIVGNAQQRVPVDMGQLKQSIGSTKASIELNRSVIFANTNYAANVEFGTGSKVKVPSGFEKLASQFKDKGIGNFDDFLDSIREWCKRKGIDEKLAYVIASSILKRGIKPQPYFIPSYLIGIASYQKSITKFLEREAKKYNSKK